MPLYPRTAGVSKFTWTRIPVGVLDLLSVWFQLRFGRKPMLFFGVLGAVALPHRASWPGIVALVLRFGFDIGFRPLLNLVETMVISGIVLFGFGFVGELIAGLREEIARARPRPRPHRATPITGTDRMRVVFLTHNFPRWPGDVSGAFLATLAQALVRRGIDVRVLAPSDAGQGGRGGVRGRAGRRVRYAAARRETLAYRGTMQDARSRGPGGLASPWPASGARSGGRRGEEMAPGRGPGARALVGTGRARDSAPDAPRCSRCTAPMRALLRRSAVARTARHAGHPARPGRHRGLPRARAMAPDASAVHVPDDQIQPMPVDAVPVSLDQRRRRAPSSSPG